MKSTLTRLHMATLIGAACCSILVLIGGVAGLAVDASAATCTDTAYHQLDFWVGNWDVFDVGGKAKIADARIDSILDGCVIREDYRDVTGHEGQSFTVYDVARGLWHQTWVTNDGVLLEIEGRFDHDEMMLSGKNQKGEIVSGTWALVNDEMRETAKKSADSGNTWQPWFDIVFRRPSPIARDSSHTAVHAIDDRTTVEVLDTEYQEAVKRNDWSTMDRILSEDFVLVTSSGKNYTKPDLLAEAKSGRVIYTHQEDTDKTVRLWDDTAVVTAKLWEKGTDNEKPFEHKLWFSDLYRRTPSGWRYVFAQSAYRPDDSVH